MSRSLPRTVLFGLSGVALALVTLGAGCSSLTEPNAITVTKEKEEAAPAQPAQAAPKPAAPGAQPGAQPGQPGAAAPGAPRPVQPPQGMPAPNKGGSCGG